MDGSQVVAYQFSHDDERAMNCRRTGKDTFAPANSVLGSSFETVPPVCGSSTHLVGHSSGPRDILAA